MKPKVYLAKSNSSNPKTVARVREYLERRVGAQVVEWISDGRSKYSAKPLLECEYMVVVPSDLDCYATNIGKGLYTEIEYFSEKNDAERIMIVVGVHRDGKVSASNFREMELDRTDSWVRFATLFLETVTEAELETFIKTDIGLYTSYGLRISDKLEKIKLADSSSFDVEEYFETDDVPTPVTNKEMYLLIG